MTLRSLNSGDIDALTRFLRSCAVARMRDLDKVDDVVQETLVAALSPRARYDGRSSLRTWLFGVLRHKIADHFRATSMNRARTARGARLSRRSGAHP